MMASNAFHTAKHSPKMTMKDFMNTRLVTDNPNYSAHKSNEKFFRTIDESPIFVPGSTPTHKGGMGSRNGKRHISLPPSPLKSSVAAPHPID
jgi:hypothetical protein